MSLKQERVYLDGERAAWRQVLTLALQKLGYLDGQPVDLTKWVVEREEAVAALRRVCADHGDNDWSEHLHLGDVIEKHLAAHLENQP